MANHPNRLKMAHVLTIEDAKKHIITIKNRFLRNGIKVDSRRCPVNIKSELLYECYVTAFIGDSEGLFERQVMAYAGVPQWGLSPHSGESWESVEEKFRPSANDRQKILWQALLELDAEK